MASGKIRRPNALKLSKLSISSPEPDSSTSSGTDPTSACALTKADSRSVDLDHEGYPKSPITQESCGFPDAFNAIRPHLPGAQTGIRDCVDVRVDLENEDNTSNTTIEQLNKVTDCRQHKVDRPVVGWRYYIITCVVSVAASLLAVLLFWVLTRHQGTVASPPAVIEAQTEATLTKWGFPSEDRYPGVSDPPIHHSSLLYLMDFQTGDNSTVINGWSKQHDVAYVGKQLTFNAETGSLNVNQDGYYMIVLHLSYSVLSPGSKLFKTEVLKLIKGTTKPEVVLREEQGVNCSVTGTIPCYNVMLQNTLRLRAGDQLNVTSNCVRCVMRGDYSGYWGVYLQSFDNDELLMTINE